MLNFFVLFALSFAQFTPAASNQETLKHLQLFFRHGERTPTVYLVFPTESADILKDFPYDFGELTNTGMWQEYTLGSNIRATYGKFIGSKYRPLEIKTYSGADNRTIVSAQLVLASLLPPQGAQIWNSQMLWQPIPVVTEAIIDEVSFGILDHCPLLKATIVNMPEYGQIYASYSNAIRDLTKKTGIDIPDIDSFQKVLDAIYSRSYLKDLLPLPSWAEDDAYIEEIGRLHVDVHQRFVDLFIDPIGSWHFDQLVGRMEDSINNRTRQRTVLYSAHDTNFITLGRFLKISIIDEVLPDYGSYLAFELHQVKKEYFVEIFLHPKLNGSRTPLEIAECHRPCNFNTFRSLRSRFTSDQWVSLCRGTPSVGQDDNCTLYGSIAGGLIILVVLLIGSLLSLLWSCYTYKRKYESLNAWTDDRKPLLIRE